MDRYTVSNSAGGRTVTRLGRTARLSYAVIDRHTGERVSWHRSFQAARLEARRRNGHTGS